MNLAAAALDDSARVRVRLPSPHELVWEPDRHLQREMPQVGFDPQAAIVRQGMQVATGGAGLPPRLLSRSTLPDPEGRIPALSEAVARLRVVHESVRRPGRWSACG